MNWNAWFYFDETCGSCLRWKVDRFAGGKLLVSAGDEAGTIGGQNYYRVQLESKVYTVHRIIWEMLRGVIPEGMEVDHQDRVKNNNRISNLRLVTKSGNARNRKLRVDSKTGINAINRRERKLPSGTLYACWIARFVDSKGVRHSKEFSEAKFGPDKAVQLAREYIEQYRKPEHGYTDNHGVGE